MHPALASRHLFSRRLLAAAFALLTAFTAHAGTVQTENREATGFHAITLRNSIKLVLRQGAREGIELRAESKVLPLIEARVVDGVLDITTRRGVSFTTREDITAIIDLKTLDALTIQGSGAVTADALKLGGFKLVVSGSGDVRLPKLTADDVSVKVQGSGDVKLGGTAAKVGISVAGSGDVDTSELEADTVSVSIAGSGDASVNARKTLTVSIAGSGDVAYVGDAAVKTSIAGSGSVKKR